jgi:hypothetical protein
LYELILRGYKHAIVRIENVEGSVLGLLPPTENLPVYAEVDEMFHPLPASTKGLHAVEEAERLVHGNVEDIDKSINLIVELTREEQPPLKTAMFERLREHFSKGEEWGVEDIPVQLFYLLPWELFDIYLRRLVLLAQNDSKVMRPHVALPDIGSCFVFVRRSLARKLTDLVEKLESRTEPDVLLSSAHSFIKALRDSRVERFPPNVRKNLIQAVDKLANGFVVRQILPRLESKQIVEATSTINMANELLPMLSQISKTERPVAGAQRVVRRLSDILRLADLATPELAYARDGADIALVLPIGQIHDALFAAYGVKSPCDVRGEFLQATSKLNLYIDFAIEDADLVAKAQLAVVVKSDTGTVLVKSPVDPISGSALLEGIKVSREAWKSLMIDIGSEL